MMSKSFSRSSPLIGWVVALLLLVAQQMALAHGVGHQGSRWKGEDSSPLHSDKVCEQCAQGTNLGTGLTSKSADCSALAQYTFESPRSESVHESTTRPPFSSRAPPVSPRHTI